MNLEKMDSFFDVRVDGYENHMMTTIEGADEYYKVVADLVPKQTKELLDLGCGTGLEIDEIFNRLPQIKVTGIDLSSGMLNHLREKYSHGKQNIELVQSDYFAYDMKINHYDCVVSVQSLHHFRPEKKVTLYKRIKESIKTNGIYIEADYMVKSQEEQDKLFEAYSQQTEEDCGVFHFDTPCSVDNQIEMLKMAGFRSVEIKWNVGNTYVLLAK